MTSPHIADDPPIDPGIARALARAKELGAKPRDLDDIPGARVQMRREQGWWREQQVALAEVRDDVLPVGGRDAAIRIYRPRQDLIGPVILYLHGGGWCLGDIETHDNTARGVAAGADAVVVSLDYALAPEARFPRGYEDTLAAAEALRGQAGARLGLDARVLMLAGDSAGANLALAAAMALRDAGAPAQGLGLFYGAYETRFDTASYRRFGSGRYGLSQPEMARFFDYYFSTPADRHDWRACPLRGELAGLPPAYLLACGLDVLRDDTLALAAALAQAGVRYRLDLLPGAVHGFLRFGPAVPLAHEALNAAGGYLRSVAG
jgi:acetyl esterase